MGLIENVEGQSFLDYFNDVRNVSSGAKRLVGFERAAILRRL